MLVDVARLEREYHSRRPELDEPNQLVSIGTSGHRGSAFTHEEDFVMPYVRDLKNVLDMEAIRSAGLKLAVDPLGGAARPYWEPINSVYGLDINVVNPATHDNATTRGWFEELPDHERRRLWSYLRRAEGEIHDAASELIRLAWSSPAVLAIAPFQDLLNLGSEGRMNVPGCPEGNWRWRATQHMLSARDFQWLGDLTKISNRSASVQLPVMEAAL
jgi:hypothetical protein